MPRPRGKAEEILRDDFGAGPNRASSSVAPRGTPRSGLGAEGSVAREGQGRVISSCLKSRTVESDLRNFRSIKFSLQNSV